MKTIDVIIKLDPVEDGAKFLGTEPEREERRGLIMGTNGDFRKVDEQEVRKILRDLKDNIGADLLGRTDYVVAFNGKKVLKKNGHKYLVGSVLIVKDEENGIELLNDQEIKEAQTEFLSRLVPLQANGFSLAAYEIG